MTTMTHASIRPPAVSDAFYPGDPAQLGRTLDGFLDGDPAADTREVRALVVPHAGYVFSGALAGRAYRRLAAQAARIRRVVLLGPCHRVWVPGMALPAADAFATPLGDITVEDSLRRALAAERGVEICDEAHEQEHALEVQLPFLQRLLADFTVLPVIVGGAETDAVASLVERCLDDPETLVVVSTDLSHFHGEPDARQRDARTARRVEALRDDLSGEDACGAAPLNGLLRAARRRGMGIERVGLTNSAAAGGPATRVVGYGAWALTDEAAEAQGPQTP
jgi:AmmeMemoRadiSam system protein B